MRGKTLDRFNKLLEKNIRMLSILKSEIAANTQATGHNTHAVENIAKGFEALANHTGEWRIEDKKHHKGEAEADKEKLDKADEIIKALNKLTEA